MALDFVVCESIKKKILSMQSTMKYLSDIVKNIPEQTVKRKKSQKERIIDDRDRERNDSKTRSVQGSG